MKTYLFKVCLIIALLAGTAEAALTTNSWNASSGKWETSVNWDHGVPSILHSLNVVTGGVPIGGKVITIDVATVFSNLINGCLTISNLTVGGNAMSPHSLFLDNASNTPGNTGLDVVNAFSITSHGALSITNSYLHVSTLGMNGGIFDDGFILLNTGTLITHTSIGSPVAIGYNGVGQMTMLDGFWQTYRIIVGYNVGSQGTLTIAGGTVEDDEDLAVGNWEGGAGTVWLTGGQLIQSNPVGGTTIGGEGAGQMIVSNGIWQSAEGAGVGAQGTLTIAGGSSTFSGEVTYALAAGAFRGTSTATIWMTGGQLLTSNIASIGLSGPGQMTVSNGTWQAAPVFVGDDESEMGIPGTGTLTIAGGTNTFSSLYLGIVSNCVGTVWLKGGLSTVIDKTYISESGAGRITISNGTWSASEMNIGVTADSFGTLTVSGGGLFVTNGIGRIIVGGARSDLLPQESGSGQGRMSVVSGSVVASEVDVGANNSPRGDLTISGSGSLTVLSEMTVGDCDSNTLGTVVMTGGRLYVTNATHDAVLEVRNGFFLLEGGTLVVDKLVVTNGCFGVFDHSGGSLSVGTLILDPNGDADGDGLPNWWEQAHGLDPLDSQGNNGPDGDPDGDGYANLEEYFAGSDPLNPLSTPLQVVAPPFQITSIVRSGNNIVLTWNTAGGLTNQVQVTSGSSYSTNGFTNLGTQMVINGTGILTTNYTDVGGATNKPARYYRVRLVP